MNSIKDYSNYKPHLDAKWDAHHKNGEIFAVGQSNNGLPTVLSEKLDVFKSQYISAIVSKKIDLPLA